MSCNLDCTGDRTTLVLGLGNPILTDDAVGLCVVREVVRQVGSVTGVEFRERCVGGLDLLLEIEGFDRLIVVDALHAPGTTPGRVHLLEDTQLGSPSLEGVRDHWLNLPTAIQLGHRLGRTMPQRVCAVAIDVGNSIFDFGENLTPPIAGAVETAVRMVLSLLGKNCGAQARSRSPGSGALA